MSSNNWFLSGLNFLLASYDSHQEQSWRGESRRWRGEDVDHALYNLNVKAKETAGRVHENQWRAESMEQRDHDNVAFKWLMHSRRTRSEIKLKLEQLKGVALMSSLLAGFACTSFNQFDYDPSTVTAAVNWVYALTTALAVGLASNAMVLATIVQASLVKTYTFYVSVAAEAEYFVACKRFLTMYSPGQIPLNPALDGRNVDRLWKDQFAPAFKSLYIIFLLAVPSFIANVAVAMWIVFNPVPPEKAPCVRQGDAGIGPTGPTGPCLSPANTTGNVSSTTGATFALGVPIAANVVLMLSLLLSLLLTWRFVQHMLGRGMPLEQPKTLSWGMPFDWDVALSRAPRRLTTFTASQADSGLHRAPLSSSNMAAAARLRLRNIVGGIRSARGEHTLRHPVYHAQGLAVGVGGPPCDRRTLA